jgi:hypothetical protein
VQAIALLDTLDKDVNTFIMRVREWYGWHFPELAKIVNDNFQYAQLVMLAKDKSNIEASMLEDIKDVTGDAEIAEQVCALAALLLCTGWRPKRGAEHCCPGISKCAAFEAARVAPFLSKHKCSPSKHRL